MYMYMPHLHSHNVHVTIVTSTERTTRTESFMSLFSQLSVMTAFSINPFSTTHIFPVPPHQNRQILEIRFPDLYSSIPHKMRILES